MHTCNYKQCACHKRAETFFTAMGIFRFSVKLLQIPMSKKGLLLNRIPGATRSKLYDTVPLHVLVLGMVLRVLCPNCWSVSSCCAVTNDGLAVL